MGGNVIIVQEDTWSLVLGCFRLISKPAYFLSAALLPLQPVSPWKGLPPADTGSLLATDLNCLAREVHSRSRSLKKLRLFVT